MVVEELEFDKNRLLKNFKKSKFRKNNFRENKLNLERN